MNKPNALDAFLKPAQTQEESTIKKPSKSAAERNFPFRLSDSDHRALKMLAARDSVSMQSLIFDAVKAHAKARGVNLS
jgi:predicted HicB family RNase H-like nuclease